MARVVKDADVRRDELLDTALTLFLERGVDNVSVEQITNEVGVAKGTFYHYFATKSDLIEQLVRRFATELFDVIEGALAEVDGGAIERFRALVAASSSAKLGRRAETMMLTRSLYEENNLMLRVRLRDGWMERTRPIILGIIAQGQAEGVFHVPDVESMTDVWLSLWFDFGMHIAELFFMAQDDPSRMGDLMKASRALVVAQERVLGAAPGTLDMGIEQAVEQVLTGKA